MQSRWRSLPGSEAIVEESGTDRRGGDDRRRRSPETRVVWELATRESCAAVFQAEDGRSQTDPPQPVVPLYPTRSDLQIPTTHFHPLKQAPSKYPTRNAHFDPPH